jgi:putative selenate reductase FAD-binding subunit
MIPFSGDPSYNDPFTKTRGSGEGANMTEEFHRPATVREAVGLKRRYQARAAYLAGGTWLNSTESGGPPQHVISLAGLGLDRVEPKAGRVEIGALCRLQRLAGDRRVPAPLRAALTQVVSRNLREIATLGGHIGARYSHSDVLPMLLALEVVLELAGTGRPRRMCLEEYLGTTPTGLITKVLVPKPKAGRVAACRAFRVSGNARSLVSAAVSVTPERGVLKRPIVALGGVGRTAVRLVRFEQALAGRPLPSLDELQAMASRTVRVGDSFEGSAAFRRYEAGVVVALALRDALAGKGAAR